MKGVAWLSIVGLLAFLCIVLCLLRFGIEEIQAGAISWDFIDLSTVPLRSFHLASNFSLLPRSTIHIIISYTHIGDAYRIFICSRCSLQNSWQPLTAYSGGNMLHLSGCEAFNIFQPYSWMQLPPSRRCCIPRCVASSAVVWCPQLR